MENILQKIAEIEKEAKNILDNALEKKASLEQTCADELNAKRAQLFAAADKHIAEKMLEFSSNANIEKEKNQKEFEKSKLLLENSLTTEKSTYIDNIFKKLTTV